MVDLVEAVSAGIDPREVNGLCVRADGGHLRTQSRKIGALTTRCGLKSISTA